MGTTGIISPAENVLGLIEADDSEIPAIAIEEKKRMKEFSIYFLFRITIQDTFVELEAFKMFS